MTKITKPVEGALYMLKRGFKVFPLKPNDKKPLFEGWQQWAEEATEDKVNKFGIANPMHNWGVYAGASNLCVLDLDLKKGKDGIEALKHLAIEKNKTVPPTLTIETTTKGIHCYYYGKTKSTVNRLGDGIDTRSDGGYVVAPGSRIDDRIYTIIKQAEIQKLPQWLGDCLQETKKEKLVLSDKAQVPEGERNNTLARLAGTMRSNGMDQDAILQALLSTNQNRFELPLENHEVEIIAKSISKYEPKYALTQALFRDTPKKLMAKISKDLRPEREVPLRKWVMENRYIRGFVSVVVAPGGTGKSMLALLDAIAISTGQPLTHFEVKERGAVWFYNTEDPLEEQERRFFALLRQHNIQREEVENVHLTGCEVPLILVKQSRHDIVINTDAVDLMINYINTNNISTLIVDPFVRTHQVNENDNMQIDQVLQCFQTISKKTNCAIGLIHHTRKPGSSSANNNDANMSRGASSLINAARISHNLANMTEDEALRFGIAKEKRSWYMRLDGAKGNLQPPAENANWFEKHSVRILNGEKVGAISKSSIVDISIQRKEKEILYESKDLAPVLNELLEIGKRANISTILNEIVRRPQFQHLFPPGKELNKQRGREWLIKILTYKSGIVYNKKEFSYESSTEGKNRHWIACSKFNDFLD